MSNETYNTLLLISFMVFSIGLLWIVYYQLIKKILSSQSPRKIIVEFKSLSDKAVVPNYATIGASGCDLTSTETVVIEPGQTVLVGTGLSVAIPVGFEMQVRPRSGTSLKTPIRVANSPGTVDADYRGEVKVICHNTGSTPFEIKEGERIAQAVFAETIQADFLKVETLSSTDRGSGGFGSTGK